MSNFKRIFAILMLGLLAAPVPEAPAIAETVRALQQGGDLAAFAQIGPNAKTAMGSDMFDPRQALVTGSLTVKSRCSRQTILACPASSKPSH